MNSRESEPVDITEQFMAERATPGGDAGEPETARPKHFLRLPTLFLPDPTGGLEKLTGGLIEDPWIPIIRKFMDAIDRRVGRGK